MASSTCVRKSLLSLSSWKHNNGGPSPSAVPPSKERSDSNASCQTTSALALATSNMVDFWNRVSQQMAYIDGSTGSPSLIDGGSTRSSQPNECLRDSLVPSADNRSSSLLDEQNLRSDSVLEEIYCERSASVLDDGNSHSVSLLDGGNDLIISSIREDVIGPLRSSDISHVEVKKPFKQRRPTEITSPLSYKSCSGSRHTATTCSLETSPTLSPTRLHRVHSSTLHRHINPQTTPHISFQKEASVVTGDQEKRSRNKPWYRRASSADKQPKNSASLDSNQTDEDQSAIWHHVFREVESVYAKDGERSETSYKNYFNDDDDYYYYDDDYAKDGMELELLQPTADSGSGKARPLDGTAVIPSSATSTSVVMETASIGGGRVTTRTRLRRYQQQFSFCAGDRRMSVSGDVLVTFENECNLKAFKPRRGSG